MVPLQSNISRFKFTVINTVKPASLRQMILSTCKKYNGKINEISEIIILFFKKWKLYFLKMEILHYKMEILPFKNGDSTFQNGNFTF